MFRLLRVIIRPSDELTQGYLIPSTLRDPVALTMGGIIVVYHYHTTHCKRYRIPECTRLLDSLGSVH